MTSLFSPLSLSLSHEKIMVKSIFFFRGEGGRKIYQKRIDSNNIFFLSMEKFYPDIYVLKLLLLLLKFEVVMIMCNFLSTACRILIGRIFRKRMKQNRKKKKEYSTSLGALDSNSDMYSFV